MGEKVIMPMLPDVILLGVPVSCSRVFYSPCAVYNIDARYVNHYQLPITNYLLPITHHWKISINTASPIEFADNLQRSA